MDTAVSAEPAVLPEAVQLVPTFDGGRLRAELSSVTAQTWDKQRIYGASGVGAPTDIDWRVLALRSPGGAAGRTDPGGPGPDDFAPTRWLDQMPYLRDVLSEIPAPLNAVRLMALGPGAVSAEHCDPKYSLRRGLIRLHIPIITNPEAVLVLDGVAHHWQPGQFWFGDFNKPHWVQNRGTTTRIHVVIDALITQELVELFPQQWRRGVAVGDALLNRRSIPALPSTCPWLPYSIEVPRTFTDFGHDDSLGPDGSVANIQIDSANGRVSLIDAAERPFALVHVSDDEFRFAGWSEQRTIQLRTDSAVLRVREGRRLVRELTVPAVTPPGR